jgi:phenazine biosynthesis protein PhzF family
MQRNVINATVFGRNGGRGNPAAIVLDAAQLTEREMQSVAAREGVETTFVSRPESADDRWRMRFFLPQGEMSMCVHGAIGAVAALVAQGPFMPPAIVVQTVVGELDLTWRHAGNGIFAWIDQFAAQFGPPIDSTEEILDALEIDDSAIDPVAGPVQVVSVSRPKLLVPVIDVDILDALSPSIEKLNAVCTNSERRAFTHSLVIRARTIVKLMRGSFQLAPNIEKTQLLVWRPPRSLPTCCVTAHIRRSAATRNPR